MLLKQHTQLPQTPFIPCSDLCLAFLRIPVALKRRHLTFSRSMSVSGSSEAVHTGLQDLCESISVYSGSHPMVTGTERLLKRAQRDLTSVLALVRQQQDIPSPSFTLDLPEGVANLAVAAQLQGARNNLRGVQAELDVAQQAPGVVCLGAKFHGRISAGEPLVSVHVVLVLNSCNGGHW